MHNPAPSSREGTPASYLYLLVSQARPDIYKLGVTDALPARIASLHGSFGAFDLSASALVGADTRRGVLDLERTLQVLFGAPECRADAPAISPCLYPEDVFVSNGHTEWFQHKVFEGMLTVVSELVDRDANFGAARFTTPTRGIPAAWAMLDPDARPYSHEERRLRERERRERGGREALAQSEEAFRRLRAWVEARRDRLVAVSQPEEDDRGVLRRAFTFALAPGTIPTGLHPGTGEWNEIAPLSCLYCHSLTGQICHNYLEEIHLPSEDEATHTICFALDPFFLNAIPEQLSPPSDLPRRIWNWMVGPQERVCPQDRMSRDHPDSPR